MAPFDSPYSSKLITKLSPLIEGQVPDFIQSDHPVFVKFLKYYYQFLEAGELTVSVTIDNVLLELETTSHLLNQDGTKIVYETSSGSSGKFTLNETISGGTSNATATVLVDDLANNRLFISSQQQFQNGETVTGATSGAFGTVTKYRANPVQNIQQMLSYADTDNTIYDFLDQLRDEFMNAIPETLATGLDKRNLIKNIRELYRAKGTKEGHKIFMRMLLDVDAEIFYPNKYMLNASDGKWDRQTLLRTSPSANSIATEIIGQNITGGTSGAIANVIDASTVSQAGVTIAELQINPDSLVGTFTSGETVTAISTVQDVSMSFTIKGIVSSGAVSDGGILYSEGDLITVDTNVGNGLAEAKVESIKVGSVDGVAIDDAGTKYEVGDVLTFTTSQANTGTATGFVSVIDGAILLDGTDSDTTNAGDYLVVEPETNISLEFFNVILEGTDAASSNAGDSLVLNGTDASSTNAAHNIKMESGIFIETLDSYGTDNDQIAFEEGTVDTGAITRIFLKDGGAGYNALPTVTVTSLTGTGTALLATTNTIGAVDSIKIEDSGFNYSTAPDLTFRANFILKDVTGTFEAAKTLTTHTGTVKDWDSTTGLLETTFEDVVRVTMETSDSEEILLEDNLKDATDIISRMALNNAVSTSRYQLVDESGNRLVLNAESSALGIIVLEAGNGETAGSALVVESEDETYFPPVRLNASAADTDVGDNVANEDGTGDVILTETAVSIGASSHQLPRFILEESNASNQSNPGGTIVLNGFLDRSAITSGVILLDGTDGSSTNAGSYLINETEGNFIALNGTDASFTDAGDRLLGNVEALDGNIALDGTDSSSTDAGDNIINQDGIDFSANTTVITDSGGATGTIVNADIAKGSVSVDTKLTTSGSYGGSIVSLISEDLIRIQDSYYYQQFSYEVQAAAGTADYINELKKAVHPAGFAVFGKVSIASLVSAAIGTTGAGLSAFVGDTETYSPILASVLETIFDTTFQRRLQKLDMVVGNFDDEILLEESTADVGNVLVLDASSADLIALDGTDSSSTHAGYYITLEVADITGSITLNGTDIDSTNAGDNIILDRTDSSDTDMGDEIILESVGDRLQASTTNDGSYVLSENATSNRFNILLNGTDASSPRSDTGGSLILNGTDSSSTNAGDNLVSEDYQSHSNKLTLDGTESGHINQADAGGSILLNGTDSDSSDAGSAVEIEDDIATPLGEERQILLEPHSVKLVNEDGGTQRLETGGKSGGVGHDLSLVEVVSVKVEIPQPTPKDLTNGSIYLSRAAFGKSVGLGGIELEAGITKAGNLLLNGNTGAVDKEAFLLEQTTFTNEGIQLESGTSAGDGTLVINSTEVSAVASDWSATGTTWDNSSTTWDNAGALPDAGSNILMQNDSTSVGDGILIETATATGYDSGHILLDRTDHTGANAGDEILYEDGDSIVSNNVANTLGFEENIYYGPIDVGSVIELEEKTDANFGAGVPLTDLSDIPLNEISRSSIITIDPWHDSGNVGGSAPFDVIGILLEASTQGVFKQEDSSTVSTTHGDDIVLESATTLGVIDKLILESTRIQIEDKINKGTIPFSNYADSNISSYTRPAEIYTRDSGSVHLEDEADEATDIRLESGTDSTGILILNGVDSSSGSAGNPIAMQRVFDVPVSHGTGAMILNGTDGSSTNAGGEFFLEIGTHEDFLRNLIISGVSSKFDSTTLTMDNTSVTMDSTA